MHPCVHACLLRMCVCIVAHSPAHGIIFSRSTQPSNSVQVGCALVSVATKCGRNRSASIRVHECVRARARAHVCTCTHGVLAYPSEPVATAEAVVEPEAAAGVPAHYNVNSWQGTASTGRAEHSQPRNSQPAGPRGAQPGAIKRPPKFEVCWHAHLRLAHTTSEMWGG